MQEAGAQGIYVSVMLFNGFSVGTKGGAKLNNPWLGHPFNAANNINRIDGDANHDGLGYEVHTLASDTVVRLEEAYVKHVVDAVNDLDNVLYEISNESDSSSLAWQYHMIDLIHRYEATKQKRHPVGMTALGPVSFDVDLFASRADGVSPRATGRRAAPLPADGSKVIISDTDHLCGICGTVDWVWETLARGRYPVLMDGYDGLAVGTGALDYDGSRPVWEDVRRNLGYARSFAVRMDLAAARPYDDLASSGYCLAVPGSQYLVFAPGGGTVRVDLARAADSLAAEWFDPATGVTTPAPAVAGGAVRALAPPFPGDAVLYLQARASRKAIRSSRRHGG